MAIECFEEIFNVVYIAKRLYDIDKYELAEKNFFDVLEYDTYFEGMYSLIMELFEYCECNYFESRNVEVYIFSDPVIVDFYILAGEYGRYNGIPDSENPYIEDSYEQVRRRLNFSYCLDWMLMGHTEPIRPYHSRLGVFAYQDDFVDLGCLAYELIEIYSWFSEKCIELKSINAINKLQISLFDEGRAA